MLSRRPAPNDYERHIVLAHQHHRLALDLQGVGDGRGAADAAVQALVHASLADPTRERASFDALRTDCLAIQAAWFKATPRKVTA